MSIAARKTSIGTVEVAGLAQVRQELRQFGNHAVDHATRQMRRTAKRIEAKAKDYVPEDSEALKNSIRVVEDRKGINGRLRIDVIVGAMNADRITEDKKYKGRFTRGVAEVDINLDQYAWIIHENYESMKPGARTLVKMESIGRNKVGSGFLSRAADEERETLRKQLFDGFRFTTTG